MKILNIIIKASAAGFGWTIGKNLANKNSDQDGCLSIILLFLISAICFAVSKFL